MPIYRPFLSIEEQNEWMARSEGRLLKDFIEKVYTESAFDEFVYDSFGGVITSKSGYLDVKSFMSEVTSLLINEKSYRKDFLDLAKLKISEASVLYEDLEASSIIFCDGLKSKETPFFSWLPIRSLKGETLSVSLEKKLPIIFNRGVYLSSSAKENSFVIGSTYRPGDNSVGITVAAREELKMKAAKLLKIPFEIHHQDWGTRPTTIDRKPILGSHPVHQNVIIFNGLGTKGVSLAPYFSAVLSNWLEGKQEIPTEVNIQRFKALYSNFSSD